MHSGILPFPADSDIFLAFQALWQDVVHEPLTYQKAEEYGPTVLALVGAVARAKRQGWL